MAKTTVLIDVNIGAQVPPTTAWMVWAAPFPFDSGNTLVLPAGANVKLVNGQGQVEVDGGVWIVTAVAPGFIKTQAWRVPESEVPVQFNTLVEETDKDLIGFGPTWAARAELAALGVIAQVESAAGYAAAALVYRNQAQAIADSIAATTDALVANVFEDEDSEFRTAIEGWGNTSYARIGSGSASPLELVNFSAFGDSYAKGGAGSEDASKFWPRVALRNRTKTLSNFGVAGTRSYLILSAIEANWVPNTRGLIGLGDVVINDVRNYADSSGKLTTVETFRAMLARLSAWSIQPALSPSLVFGTGWSGGSTATGGSVDVAWNGDACQLLVGFVTGAGTTLTIRNSGTGAIVRTVNTGGYKDAFTGVVELSGYGAGEHTVRVTAAGAATVAGVVIPSPTPPVVVWFKPGAYLDGGSIESARLLEYLAACASIAAAHTNVVPVGVDSQWDTTTMLWTDGLHLNDKGNAYVADRIQSALSDLAFQQGLNQINAVSAGTYTPPAPSYISAGATAPAQVTGLTATPVPGGVTLAWTRPADNGATLTGYKAQYRTTGDTIWIDASETILGGAVTASLTIPAGPKDFRLSAINAIGTGSYSTVATATVPTPPTVYASDSFARSDGAMGSTTVGGFAWTVRDDATWAIVSGVVSCTALGSDNNTAVLINDGQSDGTLSVKLPTTATNVGLEFRYTGTQGYEFFRTATGYRLSRKSGGTTFVTIQEVAQTPVAGDVLSVVLSGSSIVCKVNGVTIISVTDASYTGTQHGLVNITAAAAGAWDDFSHTSAIA